MIAEHLADEGDAERCERCVRDVCNAHRGTGAEVPMSFEFSDATQMLTGWCFL